MASPPTSPSKAAHGHRPSRFIEGAPLTRPDFITRTPTSNELLFNILLEMDEIEARKSQQKKKFHRGSTSSTGSNDSVLFSTTTSSHSEPRSAERQRFSVDGMSRWSAADLDMQESIEKVGKIGQKFKGRLRALTSGSSRDETKIVPYPGT
ncbi:hypothetical protein BP5796_04006 [Coleophoma crateriformis]|uniref:Uncharacterized protein n=1 Tax=Coleophoma crateriformis TaxID=565419 RepID=A0A3D8SHN4_9HELO|nr:hypothetical protein BP5796_04006 [Coleophoma crateriformis]